MGKNKKPTAQTRRDFLKTLGVAAASTVPLLNSQVAMGQTTTAPVRLFVVALQHGFGFDRAHAAITGSELNYTLPRPLRALNAIKDQCVFVDALRTGYWGNAHDVSYSDLLTCAVSPDAPTAASLGGPFFLPRSPSIDWMISNHFQKPVLRLSNHYQSFGAPHHHMSFDSSLRSLPYYTNARDAYMGVIEPLKAMQGGGGTTPVRTPTSDEAVFRMLNQSSQSFLSRLEGTPRARMQSYFTALTDLGNRILQPITNQPATPSNIVLPDLPGMNLSFSNQLDQYLEMIRISFTLDTHRVAVLGMGNALPSWPWTDTNGQARSGNTFGNDFHHDVGHYNEDPNRQAAYQDWVHWHTQKIVGFVNQLKNTIDVDGRPMIDNTIIVLTGEVGNGIHDRENITHVVIGGGGAGRIRRNRWIRLPTFNSRERGGVVWASRNMNGSLDTCGINYIPVVSRHHAADLWVSIARLAGLNINTFGFDVYNYQPIQLT